MEDPQEQPATEQGTPPTPENPWPSNQTTTRNSDGTVTIRTLPLTPKVLEEYEEAIAKWPDDAELHTHYALALSTAGNRAKAREQWELSIRLRPEDDFSHFQLAALLDDEGEQNAALSEYQLALNLLLQTPQTEHRNAMEAVTRWSLGEQFKKLGRKAEAREQLEQAVSIQQSMVDKRRGDEQLLGRLKDALAEIGPE